MFRLFQFLKVVIRRVVAWSRAYVKSHTMEAALVSLLVSKVKVQPGVNADSATAKQFVKTIVKKWGKEGNLKEAQKLLEILNSASPQERTQTCVTIAKNKDGRIQVSGKKGYPYFISCQLWRWADLISRDELCSVAECQFKLTSGTQQQEQVCVNPFHYERMEIVLPEPEPMAVSVDDPSNGDGLLAPLVANLQLQPDPWATILYYQLKNRVGEMYKCLGNPVTVDGFTNPCLTSDRFSLGQFRSSSESAKVVSYIGAGVSLEYENGNVFINRLSNYGVFFQALDYNDRLNLLPSWVVKMGEVGQRTKIFCRENFEGRVEESRARGVEAVYDMVRFCSARVAFVKGWGRGYGRQDVLQTPCWIEVHFNHALQWLDPILREMGSPYGSITSFS